MANENTVVKKPSTTIGVDKYTFFKVDQDTVTELTYGTGYTLPGTVQITPTDSGNSDTFDADNNAYEVSTYIEKPGHDIENADIPPQVDAMWRGLKVDEVGGIAVNNKTISTHTLRGERDSTYCICEVTPPQQSGHFTKNHFKKRYFLHNMYYFFSEPPYKTNITARSLTKSNCPQDHMFPLHLYAPLSSSNYYPNNRIEGYLVLHQ